MRRVYDVLKAEGPETLYFLPLPHKTGEAEMRLLAGSLREMKAAHEKKTGQSFDYRKAWKECLETIARGRESVDADIVMTDGSLFDIQTKILAVYIDGERVAL